MPKPMVLNSALAAAAFRLAAAFFIFASLLAAAEEGAQPMPGASSPMPAVAPAEAEAEKPDPWQESWKDRTVALAIEGVIIGSPFSDMPDTLERALDKADADGAKLVVLEIDSPGGEVGTCDKLSKHIFEAKTPVVSLVLHKAVSGGAMVASAAPEIVMTRASRIGDIQPMQTSLTGNAPQMDDRTAEKIEVDIRTIMKVYAEHHKRPVKVMEAMVSRSSSLFQVKFRDDSVQYLSDHELKLLEKNIELGIDSRRIANTEVIKSDGKLLELSSSEALAYGVASEVVDNRAAFYESRGIDMQDVVRPEVAKGALDLKKLMPKIEDLGLPVWVVVLLGVFLIVGIAGLVTEYHAPGSGIPAAIGIIGFVCFFTTLIMHDRGSPLGIVIFLIGIALLVVEIMVLPGFGVAGILGILCILAGMLLAFTPDWSSEYMSRFMWEEVGAFTILMFLALVASIGVILIISAYGEKLPYLGRFFLTGHQAAPGDNPYAVASAETEPGESVRVRVAGYKGQSGVAETMLRPAGKVRLDSGDLLDVVTDGVYVEAGKRVTVIEAGMSRIVVAVARSEN